MEDVLACLWLAFMFLAFPGLCVGIVIEEVMKRKGP